jgi:hypothetical protein
MIKIFLLIAVVILLVIAGPWIVIWAMNTLFPSLEIPYTLETWSATILMHAFLHSSISYKK